MNTAPLINRKAPAKVRVDEGGVHLFWRDTGLNILLDDNKLSVRGMALAPRHVSVALTNACDLKCSYCYAPKMRAVLGFPQVTKWLSDLDSHGAFGVGFGGGEPTLHPRFADICQYAHDQTGLAVSFTSHGHHLTDTLLTQLAGSVNFVRVSIDGIGRNYEEIRGRSFDSLLERLNAISQTLCFGINVVVNSATISDLDEIVALAQRFRAKEILLLPEQPSNGRPGVSKETSSELRQWVSRYRSSIRLAIGASEADGFAVCEPHPSETSLQAFAHIDANGILKRTSFDNGGISLTDYEIMDALMKLKLLEATQ